MKLSPGDLIDQKYQIVRLLGTGGMGSVYEATNVRVGRRVAIKVMHKVRNQQDITRFEREARAAQIGSPYIVQVHDLGYLADGAPYMVMEYLAGESLGDRIHRVGRMRPSELVPVVKQVLEALAAAHRAGIVHRDLKPDNVFLSRPEGEERELVKLVDFGISKFTDISKQSDELSLTRAGTAVGTPHYMSPEQVQGAKDLDGRSDLYSLGVMMYRCLSGNLPFNSDEIASLMVQILVDVPKPLRELVPELDREFVALVGRGMARRAEDRYQTAAEFLSTLVAWEKSHSADLDLPLVPAGMTAITKTQGHGTAASWASSTSTPAENASETQKGWRTIVLAVAFSIAGVVGVLVAVKLLSAPRDTVAAAAVPTALLSSAGNASPAAGSVEVVPVSLNSAAPNPQVANGPANATAPSGGLPNAANRGARATEDAPGSNVAPAAPTPPTAVLASAAPVAAVSSGIPAAAQPAAPAKNGPGAAANIDPANRHMLGDL